MRAADQSDGVGRFIHALAEVYEKLEDWPALAATAQEGIRLHRGDPVRLARDYGYLAEVALASGDAQLAKQQAEQALHILKVADTLQSGQGLSRAFDLAVADQFQKELVSLPVGPGGNCPGRERERH